jgi:D-alanine-D-alanine ligase
MRNTTERLVIAVLFGGNSAEREISLNSGRHVRAALEERGHAVVPVDPAEVDTARYDWTGIDVAFNALHGPFGEDGQVQAILEACGVPYTGSGVEASRLAMSKSAAKERFLQTEVPTPEYVLIHETDTAAEIRAHALRIGFPLVVKPNSQGSSLGVTIVADEDELPAALARSFELDAFSLLERAIPGQEWTAGLIDDELLPLIRIETGREFFDFRAKYEDDDTRYLFDTGADAEVEGRVAAAARAACRALGTSGMARVDVRLDRLMQPWVLEVNTVPGFTDHSLVPKMIARTGRSFGEACERAVRSAMWQRGHLRRRVA